METLDKECLTAKELQKLLKISDRSYYNLRNKHKDLPSFKVNDSLRYNYNEVLDFLKKA